MTIDLTSLESALDILGQLLADRGLHYEVAAIGGGGLLLLGLIERTTRDLDLVALIKNQELISANPLPQPLVQSADENELNQAKSWCLTQDGSTDFERELNQAIENIHAFN